MKFEVIEKNDLWQDSRWNSLPKTWSLLTVDDIKAPDKKSIISGPFGSNISSRFFVENGIPVIRGNNLSLNIGKKFIDDGFAYLTEDKANELNTWAKKDDLVFTAVGTIGQVGIITGREKFEKYIISNKQVRLTVNNERVLPLFAYYWFASDFMVEQIVQRNTGSSVPLINLSVLKSLIIPVPPLPEQKAIAAVLSSLDDKIDLLHRQNQTLEAMAETLFRQWFVVEAQEDWLEYSVSDFAEHLKINVVPAKFSNEVFHHYSLPAFDNGKSPTVELGIEILSNKYKVVEHSILVSKLNPRVPRIWPVCNLTSDNAICSTEFQVLKPKNNELYGYLYFLLRSNDAKDALTMSASGTSGSHQRVRPEDILNIKTSLPSIEHASQYSGLVIPGIKKAGANLAQIRTLETLRDTLLPKLMSGEVRVIWNQESEIMDMV